MTDNADNTRFEVLRQQEAERNRDRERIDREAAESERAYPEGEEPGHLGNDLSRMTLLDTDLEALARGEGQEREPNEDVRRALEDLDNIDTGPFPDEE